MKQALLLSLTLALSGAPGPLAAQAISGPATAVDGDTLDMTGFRVRLFGIDAVEGEQTCERVGAPWRCGEAARALLGELVAGETVTCEQRDTDAYGRMVSVCRAGRVDLAAVMAEAGLAVALPQYSEAYVGHAERARAQKLGVWGTIFTEPAAWRAANPRADAPPRLAREERTVRVTGAAGGSSAPARSGEVYYRNCAAARAAGAAPLRAGQPGYRPEMDGDSDGVACEPYRPRR